MALKASEIHIEEIRHAHPASKIVMQCASHTYTLWLFQFQKIGIHLVWVFTKNGMLRGVLASHQYPMEIYHICAHWTCCYFFCRILTFRALFLQFSLSLSLPQFRRLIKSSLIRHYSSSGAQKMISWENARIRMVYDVWFHAKIQFFEMHFSCEHGHRDM